MRNINRKYYAGITKWLEAAEMPNRADRCEDVKGVADRRPAELALSATPSGPPTATTRQMDMDHESDSSTDRRSRYATSATAEAASGSADGLSAGPAPSAAANRRPPTTVRPSRNGDTQRSRRALSADGGLPLHAYARVLDVGGPSASSCATKENSSAATVRAVQQTRAETDALATVPEQTKSLAPVASMDAAHTPEAERQLAFLMGLIPGTKPAAETMEVENHSRKRPADASAATTCKRSATSSNSSAPTLRTQRKASRKGNKTLPPAADDEGFTQPSRKHTARAVVLPQQSAINTGNRYSGLSNDAGEPMESQQQRKSPPPPPVVIKWTGGFKEFREKIKALINVTEDDLERYLSVLDETDLPQEKNRSNRDRENGNSSSHKFGNRDNNNNSNFGSNGNGKPDQYTEQNRKNGNVQTPYIKKKERGRERSTHIQQQQ
ncbi:nucleolar and coiled-body phosphoprotein 1-like [Schistocerca gregaria]|uniref:nucleolar and coiled-body phosphoprotein 1-like n=1 Tax=Schistocerca gregaria TaxID=7010 RepID=UPI00211E6763|nr:nucleolar and coiled-body phosphoprotein 1-like [Schistocerca gregaria]